MQVLVGASCRAADAAVSSAVSSWRRPGLVEVQLEQSRPGEMVGRLPSHEAEHGYQHLERMEKSEVQHLCAVIQFYI